MVTRAKRPFASVNPVHSKCVPREWKSHFHDAWRYVNAGARLSSPSPANSNRSESATAVKSSDAILHSEKSLPPSSQLKGCILARVLSGSNFFVNLATLLSSKPSGNLALCCRNGVLPGSRTEDDITIHRVTWSLTTTRRFTIVTSRCNVNACLDRRIGGEIDNYLSLLTSFSGGII